MTSEELATLKWFSQGERDQRGMRIYWREYDYTTMQRVDLLRDRLGSKCILIRGDHGVGKESAVDCTFPEVPYGRVMMEALRLQRVSVGFYSGRSLHVDTRPFSQVPARWLAIRPSEETLLHLEGLSSLIDKRRDGWTYLLWTDELGPAALQFVAKLAS